VFRGFHYLALLFIICFAVSYYNLISFFYLVIALTMLWEGDRMLDGTEDHLWDQFYVFTYCIIFLRLLYQLPIFHLTGVVTNWSSVIGFYKTTLDDCIYRTGYLGDACGTNGYTGYISYTFIYDILIFGTILLVRTILARKEMIFVRYYIKEQRKIASIRSELISLRLEHDRLLRTHREQVDAISRLKRVTELKTIKIAREVKLEQERRETGQMAIIEGWEGAGISMGIARSKKTIGQDEDAMARASIRNHAINQLKHSGNFAMPVVPRAKAVDAPLPKLRDRRLKQMKQMMESGKTPTSKDKANSPKNPSATSPTGKDGKDGALADEGVDSSGALGSKKKQGLQVDGHEVASPKFPKRSPHSKQGGGQTSGSESDAATKPLLSHSSTAAVPSIPRLHHHHHGVPPPDQFNTAPDADNDPKPLYDALRTTVFELRIVEERIKKLKKKRAIENLNKDDELPLHLAEARDLQGVHGGPGGMGGAVPLERCSWRRRPRESCSGRGEREARREEEGCGSGEEEREDRPSECITRLTGHTGGRRGEGGVGWQ
jgi:hypothetical protein